MINLLQVAAIFSIFSPATAFARGGDISGGGQGVVCRAKNGNVTSAKLLDLAEAESYELLKLPKSSKSYLALSHHYADILDASMPNADPVARNSTAINGVEVDFSYDLNGSILRERKEAGGDGDHSIREWVNEIEKNKTLIPGDDYRIPPVGDSHPKILPGRPGCGLEQIAIYTDGDEHVHIVEAIWKHLDNVNKAGLLIHEALYRSLRTMGDTTSDQTRKAVGYLFGGMKFEWLLAGLPGKFLSCWTTDDAGSFKFLVYPRASGDSVTAQFLVYDGQVMLTKTTAVLGAAPFAGGLGIPMDRVPNQGLLSTVDRIANPLLDRPTYSFNVRAGVNGAAATATLEAVNSLGGVNALPVRCRTEMTEVTYGDRSVSVGPVTFGN